MAEKQSEFAPVGETGLNTWGGYIYEEFLQELHGDRGMKTYKEMSHNDATVSAILFAIDLLTRSSKWDVVAAEDSPEAEAEKEFVETVLSDMEMSWQEVVSEIRTAMTYGWAWFEIILKRRMGPDQRDPAKRSKYTDGKIGIRKLAIRSQTTLLNWKLSDDGDILAMVQRPPNGYGEFEIPYDRSLLFRTTSRLNNPEGKSILRGAYESWYYLKHIRGYEAVGIERELAGLPVMYVPNALLKSTDAADRAVRTTYEKLIRDLRFNEQGGAMLPSDPFKDGDGKLSTKAQFELKLLTSGGQRTIDTVSVKAGYQRDIARSVLADFIMLGSDSAGSFAMSESKSNLFLRAIEVFNDQDAEVINRDLLPYLWRFNGKSPETMPTVKPQPIAEADLDALGGFIERLTRAGAPMFPDDELENHLRSEAGLPQKEIDAE